MILVAALAAFPVITLGAPWSGDQPTGRAHAQAFAAQLELSPATAKIGDLVTVAGSGYPAGAAVDLVYHTVTGRYEIEDRSEFIGQRYEEATQVLTAITADQNGNIAGQFEVPLGYGGPHDVRGHVGDKELSQAGLMIQPTVTMSPSEGPIGTLIELQIEGVDLRDKVNTWQVLYDNRYLGFASAVTTDGVAVARFRAAGPVGTRLIEIWNNSYNSTPYLAWDTSPFRNDFEVPQSFTFEVTRDAGYLEPEIDDLSATDDPWPNEESYAGQLQLSVDRGVVGAPTTLTGSNLPPNADLELTWWTMIGNRVSGVGFTEEPVPLGTVTTDRDGAFTYEMTIPDDLGGNHRLEATAANQAVAATNLMVIPSLVSVTPTQVRAGEQIEIHLKGVGWTTYDNTYTVTYDNAHIGYVCGFSTNGDVLFRMTITGAPGTHLIDLYPTIYKGAEPTPKTFSVPQLSYAEDHPGRPLPALRLSVEVIE